MTTKIVELIYTDEKLIGEGIDGDPYRKLHQWFKKDGTLVFSKDDYFENQGGNFNCTNVIQVGG